MRPGGRSGLRRIVVLLAVAAAGPLVEPGKVIGQTASVEGWREDLDFLARELEIRHADLYHTISPEIFREEIAALKERIPTLDDDEIVLEIARVTALVGDGHTGLFLPWAAGLDYRRLPLELYADGEGYFVLAADSAYGELAGARVQKIGRTRVEDVAAAIEPLLPRDNPYGLAQFAGIYLTLPRVLATLDFVDDPASVSLTVRLPAGEVREVEVRPSPPGEAVDWHFIQPPNRLPLYLRHRDRQYWFEFLPDDGTLFVQFNSADIGSGAAEAAFAAFADSLVRLIETSPVERLVLDLRWNSGGSFLRTRHLLWALIRAEKVNREGRLFTMISAGTFSAAVALATELDQHTETLFVGAPPGGRPNSFGDLGRFTLPNSGIQLWYSRWAMHQSTRDDHRPTIFPDLRAPLTLEAYRAGVDPAMEAIAAYRPRTAVGPLLEETYRNEGIDAAVELYRRLHAEAWNAHEFDEWELSAFGYELLEEGAVDAAIELFRLYVEFYPWSPNAYDSLGDAYQEAGRIDDAVESWRRAFAIDRQYSHSRDKLLKATEP